MSILTAPHAALAVPSIPAAPPVQPDPLCPSSTCIHSVTPSHRCSDVSTSLSVIASPPPSLPLVPTPLPPKSAAARFIAVPELRQLLFASLDKASLAQWTRVEKALTYDVARELYRTVEMVVLRNRMSRVEVSLLASYGTVL